MQPEAEYSGWLRKGCYLVTSLLGGSMLLTCGLYCCGGRALFFQGLVSRVKSANPVAVEFLNDVSAGRAEDAYARTSASFRARVNLEQFRASLSRYAGLGGPYGASDLVISTT